MTLSIFMEFVVVLAATWMGARYYSQAATTRALMPLGIASASRRNS
jgi:anaerobic C4-dicarboxylate transporter